MPRHSGSDTNEVTDLQCSACGHRFPEPVLENPIELFEAKMLKHFHPYHELDVECPQCGQRLDRNRKYFGFLRGQHIKIILWAIIIGIIVTVIISFVRDFL